MHKDYQATNWRNHIHQTDSLIGRMCIDNNTKAPLDQAGVLQKLRASMLLTSAARKHLLLAAHKKENSDEATQTKSQNTQQAPVSLAHELLAHIASYVITIFKALLIKPFFHLITLPVTVVQNLVHFARKCTAWLKQALFHPDTAGELYLDHLHWLTEKTQERTDFINALAQGNINMSKEDKERALSELIALNTRQALWIHAECKRLFKDCSKHHSDTKKSLQDCTLIASMFRKQLQYISCSFNSSEQAQLIKITDPNFKAFTAHRYAAHALEEVWLPNIKKQLEEQQPLYLRLFQLPILGPVVTLLITATTKDLITVASSITLFTTSALIPSVPLFFIMALSHASREIATFGAILTLPLYYTNQWQTQSRKNAYGNTQSSFLAPMLTRALSALVILIATLDIQSALFFLVTVTLTHYAIHPEERDSLWPQAARRIRHFIQANGRPEYLKNLAYSGSALILLAGFIIINGFNPLTFLASALIFFPGTLVQSFVEEAYFRSPLAMLAKKLRWLPYEALSPQLRTNRPKLAHTLYYAANCLPGLSLLVIAGLAFGTAHTYMAYLGWTYPFLYLPIALSWGMMAIIYESVIMPSIQHAIHNTHIFTGEYTCAGFIFASCTILLNHLLHKPLSALISCVKSLTKMAYERIADQESDTHAKLLARFPEHPNPHHSDEQSTRNRQNKAIRNSRFIMQHPESNNDETRDLKNKLQILKSSDLQTIPDQDGLFETRSAVICTLKHDGIISRILRITGLFADLPPHTSSHEHQLDHAV